MVECLIIFIHAVVYTRPFTYDVTYDNDSALELRNKGMRMELFVKYH